MQQYPFIFSNKGRYRFQRHFVFWFCWWLFSSILYSFSSFTFKISYFRRLPLSAVESFFYLAPHMFLAYTLIYWAIPRFLLKGRYVLALLAVCALFIATAFVSSFMGMYALHSVREAIVGRIYLPPPHMNEMYLFPSLLAGLRGGITIGGMAAAIKLMKYWYGKEQRNLQLQRENDRVQLQLLKAQVHPHFLFNTLNNIYAYTQKSSPVASKLVMGLSDMLRYMLYECNQPFVPLEKELKMLQDFIVLEQIRYNSQLDVHLDLPSETGDLLIAPLLLLPLVENCFKHGTSQVLEHPWISLLISLEGSQLKLKLMNGKDPETASIEPKGIGIGNVRRRLELMYPGQYQMKTTDSGDAFIVDLNLVLQKIHPAKPALTQPAASYE